MAKGNLPKGLSGFLTGTAGDLLSGTVPDGARHGTNVGGGQALTEVLAQLKLSPELSQTLLDLVQSIQQRGSRGIAPAGGDPLDAGPTVKSASLSLDGGAIANLVVPGTSASESLNGTATADTIFGNSGADVITGLAGDDSLYGGSGADTISGGNGIDTIEGGLGNDRLLGDSGNDYLYDGGPSQVFFSVSESLVSVNDPVPGPPNAFPMSSNDAQSHTDQLAFASARTDGSGGYMTVWGQGIGSNAAPSQAMRLQFFDAQGNATGPTGGLRVDQLPNNSASPLPELGPFETKDEIKVVGLLGAQAGKIAIVLSSELNDPPPIDFGPNELSHNYILLLNASGGLLGYATLPTNASFSPDGNQSQVAPSVTALSDGSLVVAWQEDVRSGGVASVPDDSHVFIQRYTINGSNQLVPSGLGPVEIASSTGNNQTQPEVMALANGNVLAVFNTGIADFGTSGNLQRHGDDDDNSDYDVAFRIWNPTTGSFTGNQVTVNTTTAGNQYIFNKSVTLLTNGNFVVSWTGDTSAGGPSQVYARVFDQNGAAVTGELAVSNVVSSVNPNMDATVTALPDGGFFVVWTRDNTTTNNKDIWGQRFSANGTEIGGEFQINTAGDTTAAPNALAEDQRRPNVTTLPNGTVVITWDSGRSAQEFPTRDEEVLQRLIRFGGNNGDDSMAGGTGADIVFGESGNDTLWGGKNSDTLSGGTGIDRLYGDSGQDKLFGGDGGDTLYGGVEIDTLVGDAGNDTVEGGAAADSLYGSAGGDFVSYWQSGAAVTVDLSDLLVERGGDAEGDSVALVEHVIGSSFSDTIVGRLDPDIVATADPPENNSLIGLDGNDSLFGLSGLDYLRGDSGNDFMQGGSGADSIIGGAGALDTASYRDSNQAVTVDLSDNSTERGGTAQGDFVTQVENLIGSSFGDTLTGSAGAVANALFGGSGADTLIGLGGGDTLDGGSGSDWVYYSTSTAVQVDLLDGLPESGGDAQGDVLTAVENILGSSGNDVLRGNAANNILVGGSGGDLLRGSLGLDSLVGGSGLDTASYDGATVGVTIDLTAQSQSYIGLLDPNDVLSSIENAIGSSFADVIRGSGVLNTLHGGDGNDTLSGLAGADSLYGGSGIDTADYRASAAAVSVILNDGLAESGGDAQGDVLSAIEVVQGSSGGDLFGNAAGSGSFFGNSGLDTLQGGAGTEFFDGGSGGDILSYANSGGAVTVDLSTGLGFGGLAAGDGFTRVESLVGGSGADTLRGTDGGVANLIAGGSGGDLLRFSLGADTLYGGSGVDTVTYDGATVAVTIDLDLERQNFIGLADAEDTLSLIENAIGTSFGDVIRGDKGINALIGGEGDDTLEGRQGADTLAGGSGVDWADYTNSAAIVTVTLGSTDTQFGGHDGDEVGDTLVGIEAVRGSDVNDDGDTLASLLGAAILDGGLGDDLLIGGAGTDSYIGGFGSDRIDYQSSTAAVTVDLSSGQGFGGYAQGDRYDTVEDILGSSFADVITGIAGFNTFYGFDGADTLYGGSSTDSLVGGNDDDYIEGGSGADLIDGGAGANDVAGYTLSTSAVQVDISDSLAETGGDAEGDRLTGVEHLVGSNFNDVLTGDANVNRIFGQSGSDRLNGGLGADSLFGGSGADAVAYDALDAVIMGGVGLDTLYGNAGGDVIQLDTARFHFAGGFASFESIALGSGNDWFLGSSNAADFAAYDAGGVVVSGGSGSDNISMRGNNALVGIDDSLYGGAGRDNIWAGNGNDEVSGDSGNDLLYGGFGNDQLAGGSGFDVVYFGRDEGDDVIKDGEGLVIFWGNDALQNGPLYDGVDPSEIQISYGASTVTISFTDGSSGSVTFDKGAVTLINLFDYGNGEAGNGPTPPPNFTRDIWSADWDPGTQTFTAFTKVVDG